MSYYGLSYKDTLDLPIDVFWLMNENIKRLEAEKDMRLFMNSINSQYESDSTNSQAYLTKLVEEIGDPIKRSGIALEDEKLDSSGLNELRMMVV